jgi:hypothetical protein
MPDCGCKGHADCQLIDDPIAPYWAHRFPAEPPEEPVTGLFEDSFYEQLGLGDD